MIDYKAELKVLAIGNSFSEDAMQYLYQIAENYGVKKIILGNLYIPGCSIKQHVTEIKENLKDYIYYKNTKGDWQGKYQSGILTGLLDEDWDVISLQQVSHYCGLPKEYNQDIDFLIDFVKLNMPNKSAKLVWHMTWAYQRDSDHGGFAFYNNDQQVMYNSIIDTVKDKISSNKEFSYIIPSGTAIQNLRTSTIGDTLTRDGFHLSYALGRFATAMCWFHKITGFSVDSLNYKPNEVSTKELELVKIAVKSAVENPFKITYLD